MYTPEQIQAINRQRVSAIYEKFEDGSEPTSQLQKSEQVESKYFTHQDLDTFKEDLMKAIDDDLISDESLERAQDDLLSLSRETREINGDLVEVFVKK